MNPLMRVVQYPSRNQTFVEFILSEGRLEGSTTRMELKFEHGNDEPYSLSIDAGIDPTGYSFDMPTEPSEIPLFWAAFSTSTRLVVLNGYGVEIGSYSLSGSGDAARDFAAIATGL